MAVWDAAAKIAELPLYRLISELTGHAASPDPVPVYASGGYLYPSDELAKLEEEIRCLLDQGFTHVKIKIGVSPLKEDLKRIETVLALLPNGGHLAVDAIYGYDRVSGLEAATALEPYALRWFEDICDPLDFETLAAIADTYDPPIAAGEALFSVADARNLMLYGGAQGRPRRFSFRPRSLLWLARVLAHHRHAGRRRLAASRLSSAWGPFVFSSRGGGVGPRRRRSQPTQLPVLRWVRRRHRHRGRPRPAARCPRHRFRNPFRAQ